MFQSYNQISKLMNANIKEANHFKRRAIIKYIVGWTVMIAGIYILMKIASEPSLLNLEPTYGDLQTNKLIRAVSYLLMFIIFIGSILFLFQTGVHFKRQFKDVIVKEIVKQLIETYQLPDENQPQALKCHYSGKGRMPNKGIRKSGLFIMDKIDYAFGSDLIYGKLGLTNYFLSALSLYEKKIKENPQNLNTRGKRKKRFNGILFLSDFNKHFKGHTLLQDRKIKGYQHLKRYIRMFFITKSDGEKMNRIKLESSTFNKLFKTKTTHEIEARYILTPNFVDKLIDFRKKRRIPIDISFRQNFISIALFSNKRFFKPSIFKRMKQGQVKDVYYDLHFFLSIIEELDLNTRIWSK